MPALSAGACRTGTIDEFCDRGSTFQLKQFLIDGAPQPKIVGMLILFPKNDVFVYLGHGITNSSGCYLIFARVSFRVRYGALQVRSLRKFSVNLYRRTPHCCIPLCTQPIWLRCSAYYVRSSVTAQAFANYLYTRQFPYLPPYRQHRFPGIFFCVFFPHFSRLIYCLCPTLCVRLAPEDLQIHTCIEGAPLPSLPPAIRRKQFRIVSSRRTRVDLCAQHTTWAFLAG